MTLHAILAVLSLSQTAHAATGPVELVTRTDPQVPQPATPTGDSFGAVLSPDGSFVVFMSNAANLVTNADPGLVLNVYLRRRADGIPSLVSVNADGTGGGNSNSLVSCFTPDGRYVAFVSGASNLLPEDTNWANDVFVRDLVGQRTICVSLNPAGVPANGASTGAAMTSNGRYVAFVSAASDLVEGDTNGIPDVFRRDLQTGITTLVSAGAMAILPGGGGSAWPVISSNGQWVAFTSTASNLVPGVLNPNPEVYVRDLNSGAMFWANTNVHSLFPLWSSGTPQSYQPVLSEDGRWLAFKSARLGTSPVCLILRRDLSSGTLDLVATNADATTAGEPDGFGPAMTPSGRFIAYTTVDSAAMPRQVLLWDAQSGLTRPVSANLDGALSTNGMSTVPAVSSDGRYVAFVSDASDLVAQPVLGGFRVYLRDLVDGTTRLISAGADGEASASDCSPACSLSDDGRFVAFESPAHDLWPADRNRASDVFVRDVATGTTELISAAMAGMESSTAGDFSSMGPRCVSDDGRWVVFTSLADDLVPGDTNGCLDVFARDLVMGTNVLVSVAQDGSLAQGTSLNPVLSGDGRVVAFVSSAPNLVPRDTNRTGDVFVRNLQSGTTRLVSMNALGTGCGNTKSESPTLSRDGRYVAFTSGATNLVASDTRSAYEVFVRDLHLGMTVKPVRNGGTLSFNPVLSPNGRYVESRSSSMDYRFQVSDLQLGTTLVFPTLNVQEKSVGFSGDSRWVVTACRGEGQRPSLRFIDLEQQTNRVVPLGPPMTPAVFDATVAVNHDGRFVALSCAEPLSSADLNLTHDVYLYDAAADNLTLVSRNSEGTGAADGPSSAPSLSGDGRFLAFHSRASNLVPGDLNGARDVFLYDRLTGKIRRISLVGLGSELTDDPSSGPVLSAMGNRLVFRSAAPGLVEGDFNQVQDVFALEIVPETVVITPHPAIACAASAARDGATELSWNAAPGRAYRVQFKDDLGASSWAELPEVIEVVGSRAKVPVRLDTGAHQRFYRVVLVE